MLGAKGKVDFVISMAGIGVKGDTALTAQTNKILELTGQSMRFLYASVSYECHYKEVTLVELLY